MPKILNIYPHISLEADQYRDFNTARISEIAAFTGILAVDPLAFRRNRATAHLSIQDLNAAALRTVLSRPKIVDKTNLTINQIDRSHARVRSALRVLGPREFLAPQFFEHKIFRVAQATTKLGLGHEEAALVQDYIEGKTFQELADEREITKKDVMAQFKTFEDDAKVGNSSELAMYLMMSGEVYDYLEETTRPPDDSTAHQPLPGLSATESLSPLAFPTYADRPVLSQAEVLRRMNQPDAL